MAVNFLRINLTKSPMVYSYALWNVYTQILRYTCENKDNLEINFINKLHERSFKRIKSNELIISRFTDNMKIDDFDSFFDQDEIKLIKLINNVNGSMTHVRWISLRNECIDLLCRKGRHNFFVQFISVLVKIEPNYYDEHHEFLKFLHQLAIWRDNKSKNTEMLIEHLGELYINHCKNDELLNKIKIIIQALLEEILSKHGSSAVVNMKNSFERICYQTDDFEALYLLWKNLFESFWFSDQQAAEELIANHLEIRKMLASRSKQLCFGYFQNNNTDLVNKLVQIFLGYKMRTNVVETLKLYLAFEIWRKNSSAATEIVHLFLELNIPLSDSENRKYLDLLLKRQHDDGQRRKMSEKIDVENYKFKF
ncbi:uncharacterized protein [Chironomus tepperi]|uniref:uncharacterized protein n=1 Tax=Chironomus tepperi TaxID=113505 RepID=UPI00391FB064